MIKISDTKAIKVQGIEIDGRKYVSLRQFYKTKKDPDKWLPGRQGISIEVDFARKLAKKIKLALDGEFEILSKD